MKKTQFLLLVGCFFILSANAQNKTENRTIGSFSKIDAKGSSKIVLVSSDSNTLTVEGDEKALKYFVTEVKGNTLNIYFDNKKNLNLKGSVTVKVPVKKLEEVNLSGSGNISSDTTLDSDNFKASVDGSGKIELNVKTGKAIAELNGSGKIELHLDATKANATLNGSGKITLKGKTESFLGEVHGSGELNASELVSATTEANVHGSGNLKTNTTGSLNAGIHGSGKINYSGNPKNVNKDINGSGKISKD